MASVKDVAAVVEQLEELAGRLHDEVADGGTDFGDLARLADEIGGSADALAGAFAAIDEAFTRLLTEPDGEPESREKTGRGARRKRAEAPAASTPAKRERDDAQEQEGPSKEELLERAGELEIAGRSTMSKEELAAAIESAEAVSKDELLERAREAGIPGRSSMSKEELAEAVRSEESLSRDELLERARDADIPGRSEMSKDELREALTSQ